VWGRCVLFFATLERVTVLPAMHHEDDDTPVTRAVLFGRHAPHTLSYSSPADEGIPQICMHASKACHSPFLNPTQTYRESSSLSPFLFASDQNLRLD